MAKYLIYFVLFSPFIGILIMEQGAVSLTSYEFGYPNGASQMFLIYISLILSTFWVVQKVKILNIPFKQKSFKKKKLQHAAFLALVLNILFTLIILFGFGSINVLLGHIDKGAFRVDLGVLGFVGMGISRWTCPALLVFATFIYVKTKKKTVKMNFLLSIHFLVVSFMAASWGFKSYAFTILIPSLIILYWEIKLRNLIIISLLAVSSIIGFALLFDGGEIDTKEILGKKELFDTLNGENILTMVLYRATVLQGDVSWIMWERYTSGVEFPTYIWNLLAAFGNNISSIFLTPEEIKYYNYSMQLTAIAAKRPVGGLDGSYNVTGTVFSEGLMAGGMKGVIFFSVLAGTILGFIYKLIKKSLLYNKLVIGSLSSVYFFQVFNWLNSGNIVQLFHFSSIVFIILTILTLELILMLSTKE